MYKRLKWPLFLAAVVIASGQVGCGTPPGGASKKQDENLFKDLQQKPTLDPSTVPMQEFFPMTAGQKLTYDSYVGLTKVVLTKTMGAPSSGPRQVVEVTLDIKTPDGKTQPPQHERYMWDQSVGLFFSSGSNSDSWTEALPAKWEPGGHWAHDITVLLPNGQSVKGRIQGTMLPVDRVNTGIGSFDAVHTQVNASFANAGRRVTINREFWFVKGVGIVRRIERSPQAAVSQVLRSKS